MDQHLKEQKTNGQSCQTKDNIKQLAEKSPQIVGVHIGEELTGHMSCQQQIQICPKQ